MEPSESEIMTPKSNLSTYLTFAIIFALAVGGYFLVSGRNNPSNSLTVSPSPASLDIGQDTVTPATSLETDSASTAASPAAMTDTAVVQVEGGSFYFKPNEIKVKKGVPVTIVLTSVDMMHDFVIDELDVKTALVKKGEQAQVTFTPDKAGEYEFYCSVGSHRAQGMVGKLIVTE